MSATQEGTDTLVTKLRDAEVDGESLTDDEILVFFGLLVFAGNDTTRNTTSSGMLTLLNHPDQWQMLCEKPEMIPQAVEEILRWTSVVNHFARTVMDDVEIAGQAIPKGDKVVIWYAWAHATKTPVPTRADSTSAAKRYATWPSVAAVATSAWVPAWPGSS